MASNTPEMINYGFSILPGTENFMAIKSEAIQSTEDVHGIDIEFRNCFLEEERSLKYYSHYSYLNCFLECGSNYTFKVIILASKNPLKTRIFRIRMFLKVGFIEEYDLKNPD